MSSLRESNDPPIEVSIVSHDAGGAELLSSYVRMHQIKCAFTLGGPALNVFRRKIKNVESVPIESAIRQSKWMLCGSSWQSDLEWEAIKLARTNGIKSVAFLDHWGNYRERFIRRNKLVLPDQIWVGDEHAAIMAKAVFPEVPIELVENPFLLELEAEIEAHPILDRVCDLGLTILFVSEALREHGTLRFGNERRWGYTEEEGLHYLLTNLQVFNKPIVSIVIRPHPSEPNDKYDWVINKYNLPISIGGARPLLEEVIESDVVVGFQSMAMVVGAVAKKRVISCIPPGGRVCSLPHQEIEHLQTLCQLNT